MAKQWREFAQLCEALISAQFIFFGSAAIRRQIGAGASWDMLREKASSGLGIWSCGRRPIGDSPRQSISRSRRLGFIWNSAWGIRKGRVRRRLLRIKGTEIHYSQN